MQPEAISQIEIAGDEEEAMLDCFDSWLKQAQQG